MSDMKDILNRQMKINEELVLELGNIQLNMMDRLTEIIKLVQEAELRMKLFCKVDESGVEWYPANVLEREA